MQGFWSWFVTGSAMLIEIASRLAETEPMVARGELHEMSSTAAKKEFFDLVEEGAFYKKEIILWPTLWKKHRTRKSDPVNWSVTPFSKGNAKNIPQAPGVYAFLVKPLIPLGLEHGVLIYVGKADTSIRDRYAHYLQQAADPLQGRPVVAVWLNKYEGFLHFAYAEMKPPSKPAMYEKRLITALVPTVNRQLPAKIRRVVNAFR